MFISILYVEISLEVRWWTSVKGLKDLLNNISSPSRLHLFHDSRPTELKNATTLHDLGIECDGSVLKLVVDIESGDCRENFSLAIAPEIKADKKCLELVETVRLGLERNRVPTKTDFMDSSSGVYFMKNVNEVKVAVFKPHDEEQGMPYNPKGYAGKGELGLRSHFAPGLGYIRECIAYLMDVGNFCSVPETVLVHCAHPVFCYAPPGSQSGSHSTGNLLNFSVNNPSHSRKKSNSAANSPKKQRSGPRMYPKSGSLQRFIPAGESFEDLGYSMLSDFEVQKIALLDMRILNCDRNAANVLAMMKQPTAKDSPVDGNRNHTRDSEDEILDSIFGRSDTSYSELMDGLSRSSSVRKDDAAEVVAVDSQPNCDLDREYRHEHATGGGSFDHSPPASSYYSLVPIDHGYCFPNKLEIGDIDWAWFHYPHISRPVHPLIKEYMASIDTDELIDNIASQIRGGGGGGSGVGGPTASHINQHLLSDDCIYLMKAVNKFIKDSVAHDLTLKQIAMQLARLVDFDDNGDERSKFEALLGNAEENAYRTIEARNSPRYTVTNNAHAISNKMAGSGNDYESLSFPHIGEKEKALHAVKGSADATTATSTRISATISGTSSVLKSEPGLRSIDDEAHVSSLIENLKLYYPGVEVTEDIRHLIAEKKNKRAFSNLSNASSGSSCDSGGEFSPYEKDDGPETETYGNDVEKLVRSYGISTTGSIEDVVHSPAPIVTPPNAHPVAVKGGKKKESVRVVTPQLVDEIHSETPCSNTIAVPKVTRSSSCGSVNTHVSAESDQYVDIEPETDTEAEGGDVLGVGPFVGLESASSFMIGSRGSSKTSSPSASPSPYRNPNPPFVPNTTPSFSYGIQSPLASYYNTGSIGGGALKRMTTIDTSGCFPHHYSKSGRLIRSSSNSPSLSPKGSSGRSPPPLGSPSPSSSNLSAQASTAQIMMNAGNRSPGFGGNGASRGHPPKKSSLNDSLEAAAASIVRYASGGPSASNETNPSDSASMLPLNETVSTNTTSSYAALPAPVSLHRVVSFAGFQSEPAYDLSTYTLQNIGTGLENMDFSNSFSIGSGKSPNKGVQSPMTISVGNSASNDNLSSPHSTTHSHDTKESNVSSNVSGGGIKPRQDRVFFKKLLKERRKQIANTSEFKLLRYQMTCDAIKTLIGRLVKSSTAIV